jgi:hypothetical protein
MAFIEIKSSTRVVILIGRYAIKFPVSRRGYLQGKNEAKIWRIYKHVGLLGHLYWELFGIVCMKRYEPAKKLLRGHVKGVKMFIPPLDIYRCDLNNKANWGTENGSNVLIDYGINEYITRLYK